MGMCLKSFLAWAPPPAHHNAGKRESTIPPPAPHPYPPPPGVTSENVAEHYGVTREAQDAFAAASHAKAAAARESGKFREEIVPVATKFNNPKSGVCVCARTCVIILM